jgi:hypothetical protein
MGWVRTNRRWGGFAALFALALQFVLSFGHVHAELLTGSVGGTASVAQPAVPDDPSGHGNDHADKFCDICATLTALSTAQAALPPVLVVPVGFAIAPIAPHADHAAATTFRAAFRSRAPPAA